jgi:subfamily B ATP-binding cassette protein MsbA
MTTDMQVDLRISSPRFRRLSRERPRLVSKLTNDIGFAGRRAGRPTRLHNATIVAWSPDDLPRRVCRYRAGPPSPAPWPRSARSCAVAADGTSWRATSLLTEKLSGARLIKSFRLEGHAADRLNESFEHVYKLHERVKNCAHRSAARGAAIAVAASSRWPTGIASGI